MSISSVVTRGYGTWGSVNLVVTRGYSISAAICPTPLTVASPSSLSALTVAGAGSLDPLTTVSADVLTALPVKLPCVP